MCCIHVHPFLKVYMQCMFDVYVYSNGVYTNLCSGLVNMQLKIHFTNPSLSIYFMIDLLIWLLSFVLKCKFVKAPITTSRC